MNIKDLQAKLANSVPRRFYSLNGGFQNDTYCIERLKGGRWRTYFSERGTRSEVEQFDTEATACEYFLEWIEDAMKYETGD